MPNFSLKKWYLDVADNKGNVYIGYWVQFKWRSIKIYGYQHLFHSSKNGTTTKTGFTRQPAPFWISKNKLLWETKIVKANFTSAAKGIHKVLFYNDSGEINWHLTQPKARVTVKLPELTINGWGYTEYINVTIPIWRLPFKTLFWGRCHTDNHYLVWIKWEGKNTGNLVLFDGKLGKDLMISGNNILGNGFQLVLKKNVPLRQGQLVSTIFQPFSKITKLFPKTALQVNENKCYGNGILETDSKPEPATVIYEKVLW